MTAQPKTAPWDDDPAGASILLATGRPQHDLLVIAEPFFLTELREAWGRPASSVRLSFLPGGSAPRHTGLDDSLHSNPHHSHSLLIARGRTSLFEGKPARRTTAFARTAAARVRAALLITRATGLGGVEPGDFLPVGDHLNLAGAPLFPALGVIEAAWDEDLTARLSALDGVREPGVLALAPGPLRPTRAEAGVLAALGADGVVTDSVAEAMALASRGVRVAGLAYVDAIADQSAGRPVTTGRRAEHRAGAHSAGLIRVPAPDVVRAAVETVLTGLH